MRQRSIGEILHLARENKGWNFVDLQKKTRIHAKYLQALENNDFAAIPDADYVPGYLQTYAQTLELDASILLKAYEKGTLVAFYSAEDEAEMLSELSRSYKVKKQKRTYKPLVYLILLALAILIFVGYIVHSRVQYQMNNLASSSYSVSSQSLSTAGSTTQESSSSLSTSSSSTTTATTTNASPSITTSGSGESIVVTVTGGQTPIEIKFVGTNTTSWVNATNTSLAGGTTLSPENTTATTTLENGVTSTYITLGVVKGVSLQIAGKQVDLSGLTSPSGYITINLQ